MASYYPEGECFFVRSSLSYPGGWSAENADQFYSHVLIEYNWNEWRGKSKHNRWHARSNYSTGNGVLWDTLFGDWDCFHVGESKEKNPDKMLASSSHPNSLNWNECRDLDSGGPRKYILRPIKIHNKDTEWLWIDATIPLRAIYFPVCQKTDESFPKLCTYMVIDFKARESIELSNIDEKGRTDCPITKANGLGWSDELTWGFNVPNIITYLSIPRKLRNPEQGLFKTKNPGDELVVCARSNRPWNPSGGTTKYRSFHREMDLAKIMSATFGVEVGWRPYKYSSFIVELVKHIVNLGLGFVPGVGPLLCIAFGIGAQLLEDPDSFSRENVLGIGEAVLNVLISQAGRSKKFMAKNILPRSRKYHVTRVSQPFSIMAQPISMDRGGKHLDSPSNGDEEDEDVIEELPYEVSSMEEIMLQRGFASVPNAAGHDIKNETMDGTREESSENPN